MLLFIATILHFQYFQVYHKPPSAFVEGNVGLKRVLPSSANRDGPASGDSAAQVKIAINHNTVKDLYGGDPFSGN